MQIHQVNQICEICGEVFKRSLYHPKVTKCPDCKSGKRKCLDCIHSKKIEWILVCNITGENVTHGSPCKSWSR